MLFTDYNDPSTISDTEGEWFEIYNNTSTEIDINRLIIKRATDLHIINEEIILPPGEYYVLARSENATTALKYVYGSDITLTNVSIRQSTSCNEHSGWLSFTTKNTC